MAKVKGSITKTRGKSGKSTAKLALKTKPEKLITHAKWVEFRARLKKLAEHYGIDVKLSK